MYVLCKERALNRIGKLEIVEEGWRGGRWRKNTALSTPSNTLVAFSDSAGRTFPQKGLLKTTQCTKILQFGAEIATCSTYISINTVNLQGRMVCNQWHGQWSLHLIIIDSNYTVILHKYHVQS